MVVLTVVMVVFRSNGSESRDITALSVVEGPAEKRGDQTQCTDLKTT